MIAQTDVGNVGADFGDNPGALVAEGARHQRRNTAVAQRQVAVAYAAGRQVDSDLVTADRPQRDLLHGGGVTGLSQHDRFHSAFTNPEVS